MSELAIAKVEAIRYSDGPSGARVEIPILGGRLTRDMFLNAAKFTFSTKQDSDLRTDDYTVFPDWLGQRGTYIVVTCTTDGDLVGGAAKEEFFGKVFNWSDDLSTAKAGQTIEYTCYDRLKAATHQGTNVAESTNKLIYEVTADASDFADELTLNIPTPAPFDGYDFVPDGMLYLAVVPYDVDTDEFPLHDFGKEEYVYLPNKHQVVFVRSQQDQIDDNNTYTLRMLYFDPADTDHTVKKAITTQLTGDPFSFDGGLGIPPGEVDLDEIVSFDGVSPKKIRNLLVDKHEAPISGVWDQMRDKGLLPYNYWTRQNPVSGNVEGRYLVQNNGGAITLTTVKSSQPCTLEGIASLVESYAEASFPVDYALQATVSKTSGDYFLSTAGDEAGVLVGDEANVADGDSGTFAQFQREPADIDDELYASPDDLITLDLCPDVGDPTYRDIRRIFVRGSAPKEVDGSDFIDIPNYYERQSPRVTISASMNPITSANPGTPVSSAAVNVQMSISQISDTFDVDVPCTWIRRMRYIGIRFEQEGHFRRTKDKAFGKVKRMGYMAISRIVALGSEFITYPDGHPDQGRVPYAQLTDKGTAITGVTSTTVFDVASVDDTESNQWLNINDTIQINRAGTIHEVVALNVVGTTVTIDTPIVGLAIADGVGWRRRYQAGLSGTYWDFYREKLYQKVRFGAEQSEQITQSQAVDIDEAEAQCADRLFEIMSITRDHEVQAVYNQSVDVGITVKNNAHVSTIPWLCNRLDLILSGTGSNNEIPAVTMAVAGTNYEEDPQ